MISGGLQVGAGRHRQTRGPYSQYCLGVTALLVYSKAFPHSTRNVMEFTVHIFSDQMNNV